LGTAKIFSLKRQIKKIQTEETIPKYKKPFSEDAFDIEKRKEIAWERKGTGEKIEGKTQRMREVTSKAVNNINSIRRGRPSRGKNTFL